MPATRPICDRRGTAVPDLARPTTHILHTERSTTMHPLLVYEATREHARATAERERDVVVDRWRLERVDRPTSEARDVPGHAA